MHVTLLNNLISILLNNRGMRRSTSTIDKVPHNSQFSKRELTFTNRFLALILCTLQLFQTLSSIQVFRTYRVTVHV